MAAVAVPQAYLFRGVSYAFLTKLGQDCRKPILSGMEMHESYAGPGEFPAKSPSGLVENAIRCYRLARRLTNPVFSQQLAELGQDYAAQAIAQGADPASLPAPEEWHRVIDRVD